MRGLLLLVILVLIALVLWSLRRGPRRPRPGPAPLARDRLVKDPVCQTYVVSARAIQRAAGGDVQYFCSQECAERYGRDGGDPDRVGEHRV